MTDALADLVAEEPGLTLVGVARNGAETILLTITQRPDLLLVDLDAIDVTAAWITHKTRPYVSRSRLVGLSTHLDAASVGRTLAAGFDRHVNKGAGLVDLIPTLLEENVFLA